MAANMHENDDSQPQPAPTDPADGDKTSAPIAKSFVQGVAFAAGRKVVDNIDKIWDFFTKS